MAPSKRDSKGHEKASQLLGKAINDLVATRYNQEDLKKRKVAKWIDKMRVSLQRKMALSSVPLFGTSDSQRVSAEKAIILEKIAALQADQTIVYWDKRKKLINTDIYDKCSATELPERIASITAKIESIGEKTELLRKDAENRTVAFGTTIQVVKSMLEQQMSQTTALSAADAPSSSTANGRTEPKSAKRGMRDHLSMR